MNNITFDKEYIKLLQNYVDDKIVVHDFEQDFGFYTVEDNKKWNKRAYLSIKMKSMLNKLEDYIDEYNKLI